MLKAADWGRVRLHDRLIYADIYEGVYTCKVVQLDIQIPGELGVFPYGKTVDTGAIKISYVKEGVTLELIENLANLVKWKDQTFRDLKDLWDTLQDEKADVTAVEADFNTELSREREA